jgi:GNAT superfamily N-acetyltransferase
MSLQIVTFDASHLDDAGAVLARRQARLREAEPALPDRFTDPQHARELVAAALAAPESRGVAALLDGRLVAYLLGAPRYEPIWNRAAWSPVEGQALDPDVDADLMRDVYAAWAPHWVERGFFLHYVHAPAADRPLLDAWSNLNFGRMQAHAIRDLHEPMAATPAARGFEIRRIGPEDADSISPLYDLIARHQVLSPAYAITLPERYAAFPADYAEDIAEPGSHYWAAFEDDRPVGLAGFYETEPALMTPDGAWELGAAMTAPDARGRGIQRALLDAGFAAAHDAGARHSITDWRTANLLSSRTWTALGYRPTHFRLHRAIDPRVAWAGRAG